MSTILTAAEITVRYGDRTVLDAATLAIDEGDHIGLVGQLLQRDELNLSAPGTNDARVNG